MDDTQQYIRKSWHFNRHHVAKRVLEKHVSELERKHTFISSQSDESMRNLQRELMNLHTTVSSPDLVKVTGGNSPRISRRGSLQPKSFTSLNLASPRPEFSRLHSRRQSEPLTLDSSDLNAITRIAQETGDKVLLTNITTNYLASTPPGPDRSQTVMHRLKTRRGTFSETESIRLLPEGCLETSARVSSAPMKQRPRRGSAPGIESLIRPEKNGALSARTNKTAPGIESYIRPEKSGTLSARTSKTVEGKKRPKRKTKTTKSYKEQKGVSVSFYNEDADDEDGRSKLIPSVRKADADDNIKESSSDDSSQNEERDAVWKEVLKCRYIRGYDPPEMRVPEVDPGTFVFGRNYNDVMDERRAKAAHLQVD